MLRIFSDFDGPIVDVSERYYRVYQFCLEQIAEPNQPVTQLSKPEFWRMKRSRVPQQQIGIASGLDERQARDFAKLRRENVHKLPNLIYDRLVPGAIAALEKMQRARIDLAVLTMRRVRELEEPFNRYDLGRFFPEDRRYCLADDYVKTGDVKDKPLLLARAFAELPQAAETWAIGDTEADIVAAKTHNVKIVAVLSGIRDRAQLERHQPDFIADDLQAAVDLIWEQSSLSLATS